MQQNDLEKFILDNRDEFDDAYPSLKIWASIEKELGAETQEEEKAANIRPLRVRRPWYQIAAAAVVILTLGGFGGAYLTQQTMSEPTAQEVLEHIAPEFAEMEQYYSAQINERYAQFASHTQDPEVKADLDQIDQAMTELREELSAAPPGREQQIVQELIETYRLKLQILEHILSQIEELEQLNTTPDNNSNETSI